VCQLYKVKLGEVAADEPPKNDSNIIEYYDKADLVIDIRRFEVIKKKSINEKVASMKTVAAESAMDCARKCWAELGCKSFDFQVRKKEDEDELPKLRSCQLYSISFSEIKAEDIDDDDSMVVYNMVGCVREVNEEIVPIERDPCDDYLEYDDLRSTMVDGKIAFADLNGDGKICLSDFVSYMRDLFAGDGEACLDMTQLPVISFVLDFTDLENLNYDEAKVEQKIYEMLQSEWLNIISYEKSEL